jgi:hypothetical protein
VRRGAPSRFSILFVLAVTVACGRGPGPGDTAATAPITPDEIVTCEPGFSQIAGFEQTKRSEDPYVDHVGIRLDLEDADHHEIHYFAGIPGEFGEGLPANEQVTVAVGLQASLLGQDTTWVLAWDASGPCGRRAVLGQGLTHDEFLETIRSAGIIPAE